MDITKTKDHPSGINELPISNPVSELSDIIPSRIKVWWKHYVASKSIPYFRIGFLDHIFKGTLDYQEIIPETANHGSWILGAQPDEGIIEKINEESGRQVHLVSMLANRERILKIESSKIFRKHGGNSPIATISRRSWFDHTTLDLTTGKNQIIGSTDSKSGDFSIKSFNQKLHEAFVDYPRQTFYCHCMAGRSRSFAETMAFLFQYPNVFDFDDKGWKAILEQIRLGKSAEYLENLKRRLSNNPSFSDIAEFVELRRPRVKPLRKLDGDQAGLLGLISLAKAADGISEERIKNRDRLYKDAQDIGLMLKAPLDSAFRDLTDREAQEKNLIKAVQFFQDHGINLLTSMLVSSVNSEEEFNCEFRDLEPSEQARFAILLRQIEKAKDNESDINLGFLAGNSKDYARIAVRNVKGLTVGDQVELLRAFGNTLFFDKSDVAAFYDVAIKKTQNNFIKRVSRIFKPEIGINLYNSGIQLAELSLVATLF